MSDNVAEYIVLWLLYGKQDGWKMMDLSQTVYIGYYERQQALYAKRSERPQVWRHTINKHRLFWCYSAHLKKNGSIPNRFPEVHKHGTHTQTDRHTHTNTHDDSIRRNAMRCISPKNANFWSVSTSKQTHNVKHFSPFSMRLFNIFNKSNSTAGAVQVEQICWNSLVNIFNFDFQIASQGRRVWFSQRFDFDGKYQRL